MMIPGCSCCQTPITRDPSENGLTKIDCPTCGAYFINMLAESRLGLLPEGLRRQLSTRLRKASDAGQPLVMLDDPERYLRTA